jgi:hypothetical protein
MVPRCTATHRGSRGTDTILRRFYFQNTGGRHDPKIAVGRLSPLFAQKNPKTGKRRNLGTFKTKAAAEKHEKDVQYFKRAG